MFWKLSRYCFFWMEKRPNIDFFKFQIKIFWVVGFQNFFSWKQAIKHMSSEPENWEHPESLKVLFSDFWPQGYIFALFWQTHKSKYCTNRHDARACTCQKYHQKNLIFLRYLQNFSDRSATNIRGDIRIYFWLFFISVHGSMLLL